QPDLRHLIEHVACGEEPDWLYLAGPSGSGKTHLLLAACAEAGRLEQAATFIPLLASAGRLQQALGGQAASALVCIDGLDAIAGHAEDEVALFHFHNAARQAGARLIYAAREMPSALPWVLPDLASRLEQCTRLVVEPLDEAGRREVLRGRAGRRGMELDDAVLDYLFRRVGRDLATLTALLDRLDRASLAAQRRVTVPFLRSVLEQGDNSRNNTAPRG
ncbi:MAG: DnaA regulatory inactivator Hda, partial [Arenimonas sp.]